MQMYNEWMDKSKSMYFEQAYTGGNRVRITPSLSLSLFRDNNTPIHLSHSVTPSRRSNMQMYNAWMDKSKSMYWEQTYNTLKVEFIIMPTVTRMPRPKCMSLLCCALCVRACVSLVTVTHMPRPKCMCLLYAVRACVLVWGPFLLCAVRACVHVGA